MKGANIGAGVGFIVGAVFMIVSKYVKPLYDIVYRDSIAHLFPTSSFVWAIVKIGTPNMISNVLLGLLVFVPLIAGGAFAGLFAERKKYGLMTMVLVLVVGILALTAYYLTLPTAMMMRH